MNARTLLSVSTLLVAAALAAPAGAGAAPIAPPGGTLHVYSSMPLRGASAIGANAIVAGERLALAEAQGRAGDFAIELTSLDDGDASNWDPAATEANARRAAADPLTIAYIGELNSGASAISIPILNGAGIAQISPDNTYNGLTASAPETDKGEPGKYYPSGTRTYFRLTPRDTVQAAALAALTAADGCRRIAVADDGDVYGYGIAAGFSRSTPRKRVASWARVNRPTAKQLRAYARKLRRQRVDCFLFAGVTSNGAGPLYRAVVAANPRVRLLGADGVCEDAIVALLPSRARSRFQCTVATLGLSSYPGGAAFLASFHALVGPDVPDPYAIYGYEAMKVVLDTIAGLGAQGSDRAAVVAALHAMPPRASVLGTYRFDANGDSSLTDYGVYRIDAAGHIVFAKAVDAGPYVR